MTPGDGGNVNRHVSPAPTTTPSSQPTTPSRTRAISPPNTVGMILTCLIGLALSGYATYVEIQVEKDDGYQAMCDISEKISCTKVFASRYGKGFGIIGWIFGEESPLNTPNGELGIVFYILIGILSFFNNVWLIRFQLFIAGLSNLMSIYLAYLLYFVLDDLCVVCVGTYAVNFVLLLLTWHRLQWATYRVSVAKQD